MILVGLQIVATVQIGRYAIARAADDDCGGTLADIDFDVNIARSGQMNVAGRS
jgi:hypothetical protein